MADDEDDDIPAVARPDATELDFDLDAALASVVSVRSEIPSDAFTAPMLGTERRGNGVVIGKNGLILTIGYLITEAEQVWLTTASGAAAPATSSPTIRRPASVWSRPSGDWAWSQCPSAARAGRAGRAGGGRRRPGPRDALSARVVAKRPFAGYWEYYLDTALFTTPAHPRWGGAACIGSGGRLLGIGSLLVQEVVREGQSLVGNMIVPIDVLSPILDHLLRFGKVDAPARPWLGLFATDAADGVTVTGVATGGPAAKAGIAAGDLVVAIDSQEIEDLGDLWRKLWGPARRAYA